MYNYNNIHGMDNIILSRIYYCCHT